MRPGEIQVLRVEMGRGFLPRFLRNFGPVELHSGKVHGLNTVPEPQAMNPLFEPVMIRGNDEKADEKSGQRQVAAVVPAGFEQNDAAEKSGNKDREPPSSESGAGRGATCDPLVNPADEPLELLGPLLGP